MQIKESLKFPWALGNAIDSISFIPPSRAEKKLWGWEGGRCSRF
jgi:hypothetical protein